MSNALNKFRKRNIQTNLYQFTLVIFVVAVSVCLIFGLIINYLTLNGSVNKFYESCKVPNLWLEKNSITEDDELFLSNYDYSKRHCFESDFISDGKKYSSEFLITSGSKLNPYIVDGGKGNGCYIDVNFIDKFNIGINYSSIAFEYSLGSETKIIEFNVIGTIVVSEKLLIDDRCLIFIDEKVFLEVLKSYFEEIDDADLSAINYNQVAIYSDVDDNDIKTIQDYYSEKNETISIKTKDDNNSYTAVKKEIITSRRMIYTVPLLFVVITILVVISAIGQFVSKERYNIGLLKSLGISNKDLLKNYSGYGAILCFIGAVIGFLISPLIVPNVTFDKFDMIYNLPREEVKMSVPVLAVVLVLIASSLIGYISAFFVCKQIVRKTPKECMGGLKKIKTKIRKKSRLNIGIFGGIFKSLGLNKSRTIMSVVGIFGSLSLIEIGFGVNLIDGAGRVIKAYSSIFKGFSIVLLFLTIAILVFQIIREKYKEVAILRIHGETYAKIGMMLSLEVLIISLIAFVISIVFGQLIFMLMLKLFDIKTIFFIDFISYLKSFLIVLLMDLLLSIIIFVKICKINLSEAIKNNE